MADAALRELERAYAVSGSLEDREVLLAAGTRARMGFAWARRVMCGPAMDTFLTWQNIPSWQGVAFPGTIHLVKVDNHREKETLSPLFCRNDTRAGRPLSRDPRHIHWVSRPLHLVWRKQGEVTCKRCTRKARPFRLVSSSLIWPEDLPRPDPEEWSALLAKHQALHWGRWHPVLWEPGYPVLEFHA